MMLAEPLFEEKPRLRGLLDHFALIEAPRAAAGGASLAGAPALVVCGTIADCGDYESTAEWDEAHLPFLRRFLPYHHGVPGARWLTLLMNRIDPDLFEAAFTAFVRETWPGRPERVAIDSKTSCGGHKRTAGRAPLHLVSGFLMFQGLKLQTVNQGRSSRLDGRNSADDLVEGAPV